MKSTRYFAFVVAACVCGFPAISQEIVPDKPEPQSETVAGIIESESREALEFFIDWVSVLHRVEAGLMSRDVELTPEMREWALKALRNLQIVKNQVAIPAAGVESTTARLFAQTIFHAFEESVFRDFCLDQLSVQLADVEREAGQRALPAFDQPGAENPDIVFMALATARNDRFELELQLAEAEARSEALHRQVDEAMQKREESVAEPPEMAQIRRMLEDASAELARLQRQKEKLGTQGSDDIDAAEERMVQFDQMLREYTSQWQARQNAQREDGLGDLRRMLIEAETAHAGLATRAKLLEQRITSLEQSAAATRVAMEEMVELEARLKEIQRAYEQVSNGRVFGVRGIPAIHFR